MAGPRPCNIHGNQNVEYVTKKVLKFFNEDKPLLVNEYKLEVETFVLTFFSDEESAIELGSIENGVVNCVYSLEYFGENDPFEYICNKCLCNYIQKYSSLFPKQK